MEQLYEGGRKLKSNMLVSCHDSVAYVKNGSLKLHDMDADLCEIKNVVSYDIKNGKIALMLKDENKYINSIDEEGKVVLSDTECYFDVICHVDESFSIKVGDKWLSPRPTHDFWLVDDLAKWEHFPDRKKVYDYFDAYRESRKGKDLRLACCSGYINYGEEWYCTDFVPHENDKIYKYDITKPSVFDTDSFSFITIEHGLEHINFEGLCIFFSESLRILKTDGVLRFASPSLDNWVNYYTTDNDTNDWITHHMTDSCLPKASAMKFYSKALVFNNSMRNWGHTLLLDYRTYKNLLLLMGFKEIYQCERYVSKYEALKNMEHRGGVLNQMETLVIEAVK